MKEVNESRAISISEAFYLLKDVKSRYAHTHSVSNDMFLQTYEYVEKFCKINDKYIIDGLRIFLEDLGISDEENASVINLLPKSIEEVRLLIPSLSKYPNTILENIVFKIKELMYS